MREFAIEMSVGLAIGVAGAAILIPVMRRISLPSEALYPLRTLAVAGVVYGVATVAHGSGFLAVFVAGLFVGAADAPHKAQIERFHTSLASLAEIVVFVALGLTVDLGELDGRLVWVDGLLLAALLAFVARPVVAGPLLLPVRLRGGERLFVMWGGLKGAVPILLAAFAVIADVAEADRIYGLVFVDRALLGRRAGHVASLRSRSVSACRCGCASRRRPSYATLRACQVVPRVVRRSGGRSSAGPAATLGVAPRTAGRRPARSRHRRPASARTPRRSACCARRGHT